MQIEVLGGGDVPDLVKVVDDDSASDVVLMLRPRIRSGLLVMTQGEAVLAWLSAITDCPGGLAEGLIADVNAAIRLCKRTEAGVDRRPSKWTARVAEDGSLSLTRGGATVEQTPSGWRWRRASGTADSVAWLGQACEAALAADPAPAPRPARERRRRRRAYSRPQLRLLKAAKATRAGSRATARWTRTTLSVLETFGAPSDVTRTIAGPLVTTLEIRPHQGVRLAQVARARDELAMALQADVRVIAPVPGRQVCAVEIPRRQRRTVRLREVLQGGTYARLSAVPLALGVDPRGVPVAHGLDTYPHLLVAGTTGSGKSNALHALLLGWLFAHTPAELGLLLIDPKVLEFSAYAAGPHLLHDPITTAEGASRALSWCTGEMERRYRLLAKAGARSLAAFNDQVLEAARLPRLVVVIDELADLLGHGDFDDELLMRLAAKARACGIHLVVATQRPSVDVVTGRMKANFPARWAFRVRTITDSRVILDRGGAERLLGAGDSLLVTPDAPEPQRIHAPLVEDAELDKVLAHLAKQPRGARIRLPGVRRLAS